MSFVKFHEARLHILIVEDEPIVAKWMSKVLTEAGHRVKTTGNGDEGVHLGAAGGFDLALIDVQLPGRNGVAVVMGIRHAGQTMPIIIMTGRAGDDDIVRALDAGADDYLLKPVSNEILTASVRAALRRGGAVRSERIVVGQMTLERKTRQVTCSGRALALTPQEVLLVEHFMLRPGQVVSRADLLANVWGMNFDPASNMIDAAMNRLRAKLNARACTPRLATVRGVGFVLDVDALTR
ncbi:MAG: response regulator transcription factor [bacterium]